MATLRRYPIGCTLGLILGGLACHALAEPPAPVASNDSGLMTFPNVRVVNAPIAASEGKPVARESAAALGMRAYRGEDGQLRQATAAEAEQLSNATRTRSGIATAKTAATAAGIATVNGEAAAQLIYGPDNSIGVLLDEQTMVFQMAHKEATGKLTQQCVTGEDSAAHALHSPQAHDDATQESHNDR